MLTIDRAAAKAFPGTQMGILAIKNVAPSAPFAPTETSNAMEEIHRRFGHLDRADLKAVYPIHAYTAYYRQFGYSYHVLLQLESILKGKKQLHAESGLLQAMFLSELESMLLTAGHDLANLRTPLRLAIAAGDETYQSISGREVTTVQGDLMVCDGGGVISSILRGPDFGSRITSATTDVLFTVYAPPGIETADIMLDLQKLEGRISAFSPACDTALLRVFEA